MQTSLSLLSKAPSIVLFGPSILYVQCLTWEEIAHLVFRSSIAHLSAVQHAWQLLRPPWQHPLPDQESLVLMFFSQRKITCVGPDELQWSSVSCAACSAAARAALEASTARLGIVGSASSASSCAGLGCGDGGLELAGLISAI